MVQKREIHKSSFTKTINPLTLKKKFESIALGITIFYPTRDQLKRIIDYSEIFDNIFLYFNSPINKKISEYKIFLNRKIKIFGDGKNKGLSKAYNHLIKHCEMNSNINYLMLLDQDSIIPFKNNLNLLYLDNFQPPKDAAIITSEKISKSLIKNNDILNLLNKRNEISFERINFAINSGSLISLDKIKKIGGYDENLFLDRIDIDICKAIEKNKFSIYKLSNFFIFHDVGELKFKRIFNFSIKYNIHNPSRIYSIAESRLIFNKKWLIKNSNIPFVLKIINFSFVTFFQILKHFCLILINNESLFISIYNLFKGIINRNK